MREFKFLVALQIKFCDLSSLPGVSPRVMRSMVGSLCPGLFTLDVPQAAGVLSAEPEDGFFL